MRIAMLADMYKPHTSGVTNHISLNKAALEALGHEVWVFCFGDLEYADDEPRVVRCPGVPYGDTGYRFGLGYDRPAIELLRTMDVLHVHHPFMSGRFAVRIRRSYGVPVVFTNHTRYDLYAHVYARLVPRPLSRWYVARYLRRFCASVDAVISPSAGMRDVLRSFGVEGDIDVVPNGIDLAPFRQAEQGDAQARQTLRSQLGLSAEDVALCYLGRLGGEKRTMWLLGTFGAVARRNPAAALVFIGDGPERERLERTVRANGLQGRVVFAGAVPYAAVPPYLAACDAYVSASVSEVHPLTISESMGAGLPCLGVLSPGVADSIQDDVSGLLAEDDPVAFAEAMTRLVVDPQLRSRLAEGARARAQDFDIERTVVELAAVYERVLRQRQGAQRAQDAQDA